MLKKLNHLLKLKFTQSSSNPTNYNNKDKKSVEQWIDSPQKTFQKIKQLAKLIKQSKYPIFFTGAGISTSVGIPDYRSGPQTVVKTGAGMWNRSQQQRNQHLQPSLTHMAIKTLLDLDRVKFLVSQNTDGLHLRSGVSSQKIAQLHGNRNLQKCLSCGINYFRDYRTLSQDFGKDNKSHLTGRKCQNCNGALTDSIIYFGQKLPVEQLKKAYTHAFYSDLCVCIGSSLTVKPSANVPAIVNQRKGNLVIINIQQTPFDKIAKVKINDFSDIVMEILMQQLGISIQKFRFQHYLQIKKQPPNIYDSNFNLFEDSLNQQQLKLIGKNHNWQNFSFIKQISYRKNHEEITQLSNGPIITIPQNTQTIHLKFYGDSFHNTTSIKKPMRINVRQIEQKFKNRRFHNHQKIKIIFEEESGNWHIQDYDVQQQQV